MRDKAPVVPAIAPVDFNVREIQPVALDAPPALMERDWMSPCVWVENDGRFGIMVRAVPRVGAEKTDSGVIWGGWSNDGQTFAMLPKPAIVLGPDPEGSGYGAANCNWSHSIIAHWPEKKIGSLQTVRSPRFMSTNLGIFGHCRGRVVGASRVHVTRCFAGYFR